MDNDTVYVVIQIGDYDYHGGEKILHWAATPSEANASVERLRAKPDVCECGFVFSYTWQEVGRL